MDLTVVLPSRNEEENLPAVIADLRAAYERHGIDGEIIVINDGSTDRTGEVVEALGHERLRLITFETNRGRAHGIAAGFDAADAWAVAVMDSDGQYDPDDLPALLEALRAGADLANGVRTRRADTLWRRLVSRTYNAFVVRLLTGAVVADANSGLKALRTDALGRLAFDPTDFARGHRYLVPWAVARGLITAEVPIRHYDRVGGRSYIKAFREARYTLRDYFVYRSALRRTAAREHGAEPARSSSLSA